MVPDVFPPDVLAYGYGVDNSLSVNRTAVKLHKQRYRTHGSF
jgi:hypothetical protein